MQRTIIYTQVTKTKKDKNVEVISTQQCYKVKQDQNVQDSPSWSTPRQNSYDDEVILTAFVVERMVT